MKNSSACELYLQSSRLYLAFFDLLSSIAEIRRYQDELSEEEIEQLQLSARNLNVILAQSVKSNTHLQLV